MTMARHRMRGCRAITVALAVAWLPYIATRCVENPATHTGCRILPDAPYTHAAEAPAHSHHRMAVGQHNHQPRRAPGQTCCDLTGKCNIKVTPSTPSLAPVQLMATLPAAIHAFAQHAESLPQHAAPAFAHAPPTYLRNVTLLI